MTEATLAFGTPAYWREVADGRISWEQAEADQQDQAARSRRARQAQDAGNRTPDPRARRPAPSESRQWARELDTTAMRDDRLTPGAKALLVVLIAECGDFETLGRMLNKEYLARRMNRSARTIQRYLKQLRDYGYVSAEEVCNRIGWCIGQIIRVLPIVRPFWHSSRIMRRRKPGETEASPTKPFGLKTNTLTPAISTLSRTIKGGAALVAPHLRAIEPRPG